MQNEALTIEPGGDGAIRLVLIQLRLRLRFWLRLPQDSGHRRRRVTGGIEAGGWETNVRARNEAQLGHRQYDAERGGGVRAVEMSQR